jgi:glycerophosphoryl diester phosphodiesterase
MINYAHRGASEYAPENTLSSFYLGLLQGANGIETDVQRTKDGVLVLFHDDTVDRTMSGTGEIGNLTYAELLEMTIDEGNGIENYPDLKISTLDEALDICEKYSMRAMVEVKGGEPEDMKSFLEILSKRNFKTEPLVIDFNEDRILALRELNKEIEIWYLVNKIEDYTIEFAKENKTGIGFNFGIPKNYFRIKDAQSEGITLASWTVDFLPVLDILCALDVDYITTNRILP